MKQLILLLILIALAKFGWDYQKANVDSAKNPDVITNPVYAEVRVTFAAQNREFEAVLLAQTVDDLDCKSYTGVSLEKALGPQNAGGGVSWRMKSAECKTQLTARNAKLFENKPTFANYISMARGRPDEREVRLIYWGLTANESQLVCSFVPVLQENWKGSVSCIKAVGA